MDSFRCVPPHDLGYLARISPNLPDAKYPKADPPMSFIKDKIGLDVKCDAENFELISVYSCFYVAIKIVFLSGYA